jgi:hypothetical protein
VAGPFRATRNWLDDAKLMNRSERLAAALLADRNRESKSDDRIIACFACGHGFVCKGRQGDLNGRFCSMRCQSWHDKGIGETPSDTTSLRGWKVIAGPPSIEIGSDYYAGAFGRELIPMKQKGDGLETKCFGCGKDFLSKGLRCCSAECEKRYREREHNLAVMAEVGIKAKAKRTCSRCGSRISTWRDGRRVSSKTRFCSPKSADRARRAAA